MLLPLRDFIVVLKEDGPDKTSSGLYIGHTEEKIIKGTVVAAGSGRVTMDGTVVPLEVKAGDRVAFNKNLATEMKDDKDTYLLLREDQILCKLV